ncbi:hypothetical protein PG991_009016 [Apiospora marii]|uniref:Uncharacterized protein n=1 Tax=Apiospora marii TaxID=335849 RepID=A0ABR1RJT3_9PEZI
MVEGRSDRATPERCLGSLETVVARRGDEGVQWEATVVEPGSLSVGRIFDPILSVDMTSLHTE